MSQRCAQLGFTLIELSVCLVVMGLLATATAVSLRGTEKMRRVEDVVDQLRTIDQMARTSAVRFDRGTALRFDVEAGFVTRTDQNGASQEAVRWELPDGITIDGVRLQGHEWADRQVEVRYMPAGYSTTYAVGIQSVGGEVTYCMIAGLTGQMSRVDTREHVDAIFDALPETN